MENRHQFIELFNYVKKSYSPKQTPKISIVPNKEIVVSQILNAKISVKNIKENNLDFLMGKLNIDGLNIRINSKKIISEENIDTLLADIHERDYSDNFTVNMIITYEELKTLPFLDNADLLYLLDDIPYFLNTLLQKIKVDDIRQLKKKINIFCNRTPELGKSSIFNILEFQDQQEIKLESSSMEVISNNLLSFSNIEIIPYAYPFNDRKCRSQLSVSMLSLLSDKSDKSELYFISKDTKVVKMSQENDGFGNNYNIMSQLMSFIFSGKNTQIKRSLVKNLMYDKLNNVLSIIEINESWLESVKEQAELDYRLFIDNEVNSFINDKRDIIKDQFDLSYQMIEKANQMRRNLTNNIVYILGAFLSNFIVEGLNNESDTFRYIAVLISFLLSVFILVSNYINEEFKAHNSFEKKVALINKQYPKMYLTEENLVDDLENSISTPEIDRLKRTEKFSEIVYFILVGITFIAVVVIFWNKIIDLFNVIQPIAIFILNLVCYLFHPFYYFIYI